MVKASPAVARLTTTEAAVLALLAIEGERSAYDLVTAVEHSIGHIWSPAQSGLYALLPRLVRDGLASSRSRRGSRGARPVYRIAPSGKAALDAWLEEVEPGATDAFFLKLFVGGLSSPDTTLALVEQFHADVEARLARLREIAKSNSNRGHDWYHRHLIVYGIERCELELAWSERVVRALRRGPR
jgi:DNA-binding PadR family transcriptional regulator